MSKWRRQQQTKRTQRAEEKEAPRWGPFHQAVFVKQWVDFLDHDTLEAVCRTNRLAKAWLDEIRNRLWASSRVPPSLPSPSQVRQLLWFVQGVRLNWAYGHIGSFRWDKSDAEKKRPPCDVCLMAPEGGPRFHDTFIQIDQFLCRLARSAHLVYRRHGFVSSRGMQVQLCRSHMHTNGYCASMLKDRDGTNRRADEYRHDKDTRYTYVPYGTCELHTDQACEWARLRLQVDLDVDRTGLRATWILEEFQPLGDED